MLSLSQLAGLFEGSAGMVSFVQNACDLAIAK
jgi:hypothetical protein